MSEFVIKNPHIEVSGFYIASVATSTKRGAETRIAILEKHGIKNLQLEEWYPMPNFLEALKEISTTLGDMNMLAIAKYVALNQEMPPINSIKEVFELLNMAHLLNHRFEGKLLLNTEDEEIRNAAGGLIIAEYDEVECQAIIIDTTPYSIKNIEGWLTGIMERYQPKDSVSFSVNEDITKGSKKNSDSATFIIKW